MNLKKRSTIAVLAIALIFCAVFTACSLMGDDGKYEGTALYPDRMILDVYTDKSRYNPGDKAEIAVELQTPDSKAFKGELWLSLMHHGDVVKQQKLAVISLKPGDAGTQRATVPLPQNDFTGYLVKIYIKQGKTLFDTATTAVDVSSEWTRFPRYGYLAEYPEMDPQAVEKVIGELCKYHLNGLQFYDWQYKHHQPVAGDAANPKDSWVELANRKVSGKTVKGYISAAHGRNIAAMNYNLLFGAWVGYEKDGVKPEWGLYRDDQGKDQDFHPLPDSWASNKIYLFNPLNTDWQNYIIQKEKDVNQAFGFDGWHVDQLGDRGARYDFNGQPIDLAKSYASFLQRVRKEISEKKLVFNAVNQFGQLFVAKQADVDFLYTEVWDTSSYSFLKRYIDEGFRHTDYKKSTVLAAYMNYKKGFGTFNEPAVRLTDAVIFASGGAHIELGDTGMLSSEYFPNRKLKMSDSLKKAVRKYYDFAVAYQNFLRDGVKPLDKKVELQQGTEKIEISSIVSKKSVWYFGKQKDGVEILHLINFLANDSNDWRDDTATRKEPPLLENVTVKYYSKEKYKRILAASPDSDGGEPVKLDFTEGKDENGSYIGITVPKLHYWDMITFEKEKP